MASLILNSKEEKLLNDLLIYNKRLEEVFFTDHDENDKIIVMIDNLIQDIVNEIEPFTAYKMLNQLYRNNILSAYPGTEIRIINNLKRDLAKDRLAILLLSQALSDFYYFSYYVDNRTTGFFNYTANNMLNTLSSGYTILNYYFLLDHAESFIGLINSDQLISYDIKKRIIYEFLFLYKEMEIDFYDKDAGAIATKILANRYDAYSEFYLGAKFDTVRDAISINPFYQEALEMLKEDDDSIVDPSSLMIGKYYLDNLLEKVSDEGFEKLLTFFDMIRKGNNLDKHQKALQYINNSIEGRKKSITTS